MRIPSRRAISPARPLEAALFCAAALPRLAYLLLLRPGYSTAYWDLATSLLNNGSLALGGQKTTDFEPLYPLFLALARAIAGDRAFVVQLLQIGLSALGAVYLYRLATALSRRARVGVISALLFALHPLLVRQAAAASDLALVTTLLVVFASAFVSARTVRAAAAAGAWLGATMLTRSMVSPVVAFGAAIMIWERRPRAAGSFAVCALLLFMPFAIRNHRANGSWWPTRGGMNLYIGNSPYTPALLPDDDLDLLEAPAYALFVQAHPEMPGSSLEYDAAADAFLTKRALGYMSERPAATVRRKIVNLFYCLSPRLVPYRVAREATRVTIDPDGRVSVENSARRPIAEIVSYAIATSFILLTAAVGVFIRRRCLPSDSILWAVLATFLGVNSLYVPASRYMSPALFVLLFYSAVALDRLSEAVIARKPADARSPHRAPPPSHLGGEGTTGR